MRGGSEEGGDGRAHGDVHGMRFFKGFLAPLSAFNTLLCIKWTLISYPIRTVKSMMIGYFVILQESGEYAVVTGCECGPGHEEDVSNGRCNSEFFGLFGLEVS